MNFRLLFGGSALAAGLFVSAAPQAATLTGDFNTWAAAAGSFAPSPTLGTLYSTVTSVTLSDGATVGLAGTVLQPGSGWFPFNNGYTGDIVDTAGNSETINFAGRSALALDLSPDVGLFSSAETFTVTLSDGTTTHFSGSYPVGTTQFVGFFGGNDLITSITISAASSPDFAVAFDAPEPVSLVVLLTGLAGLGLVRRRAGG